MWTWVSTGRTHFELIAWLFLAAFRWVPSRIDTQRTCVILPGWN